MNGCVTSSAPIGKTFFVNSRAPSPVREKVKGETGTQQANIFLRIAKVTFPVRKSIKDETNAC